jgi:N-acetyl sugar amidotransferase
MKICSSCVIPETAETNTFDSDNKCSVCKQIEFKNDIDWDERGKDFDELLLKYKGKYSYDCIVPFSGGKDSAFTLWYLVKIKKLRPLVVRFDHNFLRKTTIDNTEKTINKLGVDFINFKPNFKLVKKMMMESLIRRGDFCWHCHVGISAYPVNTALKRNIPLIIYGEPSSEYSSFYKYDQLEELDVEKFNKVANLGINAEDMMEMINDRYPNDQVKIDELQEFIFPTQREIVQNNIKASYLGNYIPWDVKKQVEIIKKELDWKGDVTEGIPGEYDYEKIECMMQGLRDYLKFLKRGFGRTAHLTSIDIRNKRMTREKAKDLVKLYDGKRPKALDLFLKINEINEDEFYEIVENHVVAPYQMPEKDFLKKNHSNIVPSDIDEWSKKFER